MFNWESCDKISSKSGLPLGICCSVFDVAISCLADKFLSKDGCSDEFASKVAVRVLALRFLASSSPQCWGPSFPVKAGESVTRLIVRANRAWRKSPWKRSCLVDAVSCSVLSILWKGNASALTCEAWSALEKPTFCIVSFVCKLKLALSRVEDRQAVKATFGPCLFSNCLFGADTALLSLGNRSPIELMESLSSGALIAILVVPSKWPLSLEPLEEVD